MDFVCFSNSAPALNFTEKLTFFNFYKVVGYKLNTELYRFKNAVTWLIIWEFQWYKFRARTMRDAVDTVTRWHPPSSPGIQLRTFVFFPLWVRPTVSFSASTPALSSLTLITMSSIPSLSSSQLSVDLGKFGRAWEFLRRNAITSRLVSQLQVVYWNHGTHWKLKWH